MTTIQNDSNELSGKRALVTGGTKGMGEAMSAPEAGRRDGHYDRAHQAQ